ncbi:MAG: phosphoribosylglycinamide formyltransferase [Bacteroidia bacterium]|nr:phosphoribosylglycinamide formyltransferase [Bacteroidia bacterium]
MKNIVIFASGNGSNALNIIRYFQHSKSVKVTAVFTNNSKAGVITHANENNIPVSVFTKHQLSETNEIIDRLRELKTDVIVLAGFLLLIPQILVDNFPKRIINIHPSLLPKYGGKGMYGHHVHKAVIENNEKTSGISIHLIDGEFDKGELLATHKITVDEGETPESLALKIRALEHQFLPEEIEKFCNRL